MITSPLIAQDGEGLFIIQLYEQTDKRFWKTIPRVGFIFCPHSMSLSRASFSLNGMACLTDSWDGCRCWNYPSLSQIPHTWYIIKARQNAENFMSCDEYGDMPLGTMSE